MCLPELIVIRILLVLVRLGASATVLLTTLPQLAALRVLIPLIFLSKLLPLAGLATSQLLALQSAEYPLERDRYVIQCDDISRAGLVPDLDLLSIDSDASLTDCLLYTSDAADE